MSAGNRKIDTILDGLEKRSTLSSDGRAWLIAAADPFHDTDFALAGYPDTCTASTVVQLVKQQITVSVPTSGNGAVASGNNWDCQINLHPQMLPISLSYSTPFNNYNQILAASTSFSGGVIGGLTVTSGPTNTQMWPTQSNGTLSTNNSYLGPYAYTKGNMRVIGAAFEVVNATSDLYTQGQVTCYRMPTSAQPASFGVSRSTPVLNYQLNGVLCRLPPKNLADAQLLYGTRSWAAGEGAYVVARLNSSLNPLTQPNGRPHLFTAEDLVNNSAGVIFTANDSANCTEQSNIDIPIDISGAYFTGLSYQSTLTITVRWLIERMPGPAEADLVVLSSPSSTYDPLALELYTRCMTDMPPGVMLKENPLGEWFRSALGAVAKYAPKVADIASNLGIPGAKALGEGISAVAGAGHKAMTNSKNKKKEAKQKRAAEQGRIASSEKELKPKVQPDSKSGLAPAGLGGR